jgi:hypothetical protein
LSKFDARKLKALEELTGKEWLGTWWEGDPDRNPQAPILLKAFDDLQLYIKDKLFYDRLGKLAITSLTSTKSVSMVFAKSTSNQTSFILLVAPAVVVKLHGKIDNQDTNFNNLKIWQDKNSDGKLDEGELLSLAQAGVKSLNTNYNNSNEFSKAVVIVVKIHT